MAVPRHVAIIMDGNGRWANQRGLPREAGHEAGADTVRAIVRHAAKRGVGILTLYSFSTENWGRPDDEVKALMALLARYLQDEVGELMENRIALRGIGQLHRLPSYVQALLGQVADATAHNDRCLLQLALSYGSRLEIVEAAQALAREVAAGRLRPEDIDEAALAGRLCTAGQPDPDLIIRTSGELRLSNFLLWQAAYSELYVTDIAWPDFREADFDAALSAYDARKRRFGKTDAQLAGVP